MGIFDKIWSQVSGKRDRGGSSPASAGSPAPASFSNVSSGASTSAPAEPAAQAASAEAVDVEAIMMDLEAKTGRKSNWRESIVDLMSLLGIDNSLADRRELAKELGYTGDMSDTATMNIWLHKQVMQRMAANGGKVPANLLD